MLSDKKLSKIEKALGKETLSELESLSIEDLKSRIVNADAAIKTTTDELEHNEKYKQLKESLKALSEGLREVKKRQNSVTQYCLHLLEEKGNE